MSRAALASLFLLVLVLAQAAAASASGPAALDATFGVPAQAEGSVQADGLQWALLVFHDGGASASLDAGGAAATTYNAGWTSWQAAGAWTSQPLPGTSSSQALPPGLTAGAAFPDGRWGSLLVVADSISLRAGGLQATLAAGSPGQIATTFLPPAAVPAGVVRAQAYADSGAPSDSAALALAGRDAGAFTFTLEAHGLRRAEWYNATVSCDRAPCPDAPGYQARDLSSPAAAARIESRNYTALALSGGRAAASGHAVAAAVGGGHVDAAVDGWLRLPAARLDPCPAPCAAGSTLRADGNLTLAGLRPEPGGRLHAALGGTARSAALDETPRAGLLGAGLVAATGTAAALLVAAKVAFALFLRKRRPAPVEHPRREALRLLVAAEPGLSFREVQRQAGWANGVTRHHLARLVRDGRVEARRHGNTVRYFPAGGPGGDWRAVVHRRDPDNGWLLGLLQEAPRTQRDIVALSAARGWSRSATQRRLARLVADGILALRPSGASQVYVVVAATVTPAAPEARMWLGGTTPPQGPAAAAGLGRPAGTAAP